MRQWYKYPKLGYILACLFTIPFIARCKAQSCSRDRPEYQHLAEQLITKTKVDAKRLAQNGGISPLTSKLHTLVQTQIRYQVSSGQSDSDIRQYLVCLQKSADYDLWDEETNVPFVSQVGGAVRLRVVAYWLIRGGLGIPSTKPYLEVFRETSRGWILQASIEPDFVGSTFFAHS